MRRLPIAALVVLATLAAAAPAAGQAADFYRSLLRRGIVDYNAGKNEPALRELRISAFGLIDSVPEYETAQVYIALIHDRLKKEPEARQAIQRIFAAERISPRYATLPLDLAARAAFDAVAKKLLTSTDFARLYGSAGPPQAPPEVAGNQQAIRGKDGEPQPVQPQTPAPAPQPVPQPAIPPKAQPVPKPITPQPTPVPTPVPLPTPTPRPPAPTPAPATPPATRPQRFAEAEAALMRNNLPAARAIYRELLAAPDVDHAAAVRIAEGSYRSRDFEAALQAFDRAGALRKGEEPYRYYLAVALYEVGRYGEAKRELDAALPFIEVTPDVDRYRAKIDGAIR